jgi:plasmid stabilization system protein ParE
MKVRFSRRAARDLDAALSYAAGRSQADAARLAARVEELSLRLADFPEIGRPTDVAGVRVSRLKGIPFFVFYRVAASEVLIPHIRHSARSSPRNGDLR